ncbi:hypothetical protein [Rossellomorea arthrocnemi]|jgi:outer membrane protein OmpA-like peptidoglycan-associated protein|uniref:hypothetical protein n=1 Tax=Rossellomorea arthrocnemi TaxID=2769542 RepID=UPI00191B256C|nr:hypothetical protein [Rossellomorea arthrocnemi]
MNFISTRKIILFSFLAAILMTGCSTEDAATEPQSQTGQEEKGNPSDQISDKNQPDDEGSRTEEQAGQKDESSSGNQTTEGDKNSQEENPKEEDHAENGSETDHTLTKEQAAKILQDYKNTFMVDTSSEGTVEKYQTKEELLSHYQSIMSEELAQGYVDDFFKMENGKLKMVATEPPVWLNPDQEYKVNEQDHTTYHVIQSKSSQLRGDREYTFELEYEKDHWMVADVSSEKSGKLTKKQAEQLVKQHLGDEISESMSVEYDHMEQNQFVIHVYEQIDKGGESHIATYGWYEVNPETEEVTSLFDDGQEDSAQIKEKAQKVLDAILNDDMSTLASFVHPDKGLLISPYVNINGEDVVFQKQDIDNLYENEKIYTWGYQDGSGKPMKSTPQEYFQRYQEFSEVDQVIVDDLKQRGNVKMNIKEYFPNSHVVEFYKKGTKENANMDWSSLYIVFHKNNEGEWKAVALVSGQWTI